MSAPDSGTMTNYARPNGPDWRDCLQQLRDAEATS
jgi:hypothetical protein